LEVLSVYSANSEHGDGPVFAEEAAAGLQW